MPCIPTYAATCARSCAACELLERNVCLLAHYRCAPQRCRAAALRRQSRYQHRAREPLVRSVLMLDLTFGGLTVRTTRRSLRPFHPCVGCRVSPPETLATRYLIGAVVKHVCACGTDSDLRSYVSDYFSSAFGRSRQRFDRFEHRTYRIEAYDV